MYRFTIASRSIEGWLLVIGVALLPVYVFDSGGIQPSHALLATFSVAVLCRKGVPSNSWAILLAAISVYSFFVESFYAVFDGSNSIINGVYFFYNFILSCAVYTYCRDYGMSILVPGILISCAIVLGSTVASGVSLYSGDAGRSTAVFNNPNQLGYFSVCLLSLGYLMYRNFIIRYFFAVAICFIALMLSIFSLSKAAMISNFLVIFIALKPALDPNKKSFRAKLYVSFFWLIFVAFLLIAAIYFYVTGLAGDFAFVQRLQGMFSEADSSLLERGYLAFLDANAWAFVFGLGDSQASNIVGHEVHSTLASVLNNYGIVGFLIFGSALLLWAIKLHSIYGFWGMACIAGPAMLYGMTHNGTRFTIFWILFSASMSTVSRNKIQNYNLLY
ncbi:hypothetical protein [Marinobacter halotolerans]|uniref:hypothetical protein n=1 Tax=Marinobacter halotolerans TaxID=1569211 RepID=UPI0012469D9E|nr:hypothetical protein [Marinobacter halotolerans]